MDETTKKPESIRGWYERTTKKSRRAFVWATAVSLSVMMGMWIMAPIGTLSRLQTFNGALTVPLIGGLWIFAFIFMFLIPSREASFRAQEALEDGIGTLKNMIEEHVVPAAKTLERVLLQIEKEYPELRKRVEESLVDLKDTSKQVEKALEENQAFVGEARPVLQALKRIEDRIEDDLLEEVKLAMEVVQRMGVMPPASQKPAVQPGTPVSALGPGTPVSGLETSSPKEPDLSIALASIGKRKEKKAASQPQ